MDAHAAYAGAGDARGPAFSYFGPREVRFYRLTSRFVDSESSMPEKAKDIIYYNLAVGHHSGVMDCFKESYVVPLDVYDELCDALAAHEHAALKLSRLHEFAEIELRRDHAYLWIALIGLDGSQEAARLSEPARELLRFLAATGEDMREEVGLYLLVRSLECQR